MCLTGLDETYENDERERKREGEIETIKGKKVREKMEREHSL